MKTSLLTSTFANRLDKHATLSKRPRESELRAGALASGRVLFIILLVLLISLSQSKQFAQSSEWKDHPMNLKLYAYNKILNWNEFECYNRLIFKESSWNYKSVNGSHKGLGQMRSNWYGTLNPRKQIRVHLRYIKHRYSTACKAENHFEQVGWH
jgi:hypothetical protein